jgi:hypothetical protein
MMAAGVADSPDDVCDPLFIAPSFDRQESALVEGGKELPLTMDNVDTFAALWAQKALVVNTEEQIRLIRSGMNDVCGGTDDLITMTNAADDVGWLGLQQRLCGSMITDVGDWERMTDYIIRDGISNLVLPVVTSLFWELIGELSEEDKRKLLFFWTARITPAGGISNLKSRLVLNLVAPTEQLHVQTCFFELHLPAITNRARMQLHIVTMVAHWNQFGTE